jgi:predicted dehydrogenase
MDNRNNASEQKGSRRVRYAVVGLGYIAQAAVLPAFKHATENSELTALVTGDPQKAKKLAKKYKVPRTYSYEDYHKCIESGEIDAVYIALPNTMHSAYTVGALRAGINALCEKPMAISEEDCRAMITASEEGGAKLMIGYRLHFERANLHAVNTAQSGRLGDLRLFNSTFTMQVQEDNIRLKPEFGGGPLWDIGIYCINAARYLFRAEPESVVGFRSEGLDERFREVEDSVSAILKFPGERLASFCCSFGSAPVSTYEIVGTKGSLRADQAYEFAGEIKLSTTIEGKTSTRKFPKSDQFAPEILYFSDCILRDREPEPSGHEGQADVRIIRSLYSSLETCRPVSLRIEEPEKRPDAAQEIRRPPISRPELVHAESSSKD